mmetsp:Transcript_98500/g.254452  ORF Transcript_98500/g.254452 Transcript_98500/m.254452 type:complete len:211 (-) Transcript_98500:32-664(-)
MVVGRVWVASSTVSGSTCIDSSTQTGCAWTSSSRKAIGSCASMHVATVTRDIGGCPCPAESCNVGTKWMLLRVTVACTSLMQGMGWTRTPVSNVSNNAVCVEFSQDLSSAAASNFRANDALPITSWSTWARLPLRSILGEEQVPPTASPWSEREGTLGASGPKAICTSTSNGLRAAILLDASLRLGELPAARLAAILLHLRGDNRSRCQK